jgi:hypothetical protein
MYEKQLTCSTHNCQSYRCKTQCEDTSETSSRTWTIQMPTRSPSRHQRPIQASSNTHKNLSFKITSCGFESTKTKDLPEQFCLYQKNLRKTSTRSAWKTPDRAWRHLKNKGEAEGMLLLAKYGRRHCSLPKMSKTER